MYNPYGNSISFDDELGQFSAGGSARGSASYSGRTPAGRTPAKATPKKTTTPKAAPPKTTTLKLPWKRGADPFETILQLWNEISDASVLNKSKGVKASYKISMLPSAKGRVSFTIEQFKRGTNKRLSDPHGRSGSWSGWNFYVPKSVLYSYYDTNTGKSVVKTKTGSDVTGLLTRLLGHNREKTGRSKAKANAEIVASRQSLKDRLTTKPKAKPKAKPITTGVKPMSSRVTTGARFGVAPLKKKIELIDLGVPEATQAATVMPTWEAERERVQRERDPLVYPFDVKFPPSIEKRLKEIAKMLRLAAIQSEATSEHNTLMGDSQYKRSVMRALVDAEKCCPGNGERVVRVIMQNPNFPSRAHRHKIVLPSGENIFTETDYIVDDDDDDELGVFGLLASLAAPLIGALAGGGGGGGGGGEGAPAAAAPGMDMSALMSQITGADEMKNIVRELLATVPPPIKDQVRDVIRSVAAEGGSMKAAEAALVQNIEKKFLPQIMDAMKALKLAQVQRSATSEHNSLSQQAKRWDRMSSSQRSISKNQKKIDSRLRSLQATVDSVLDNNKLIPRRAVKLAGGNRHLDILSGRR